MLGSLLLLITALIWGSAFLAQKLGMDTPRKDTNRKR